MPSLSRNPKLVCPWSDAALCKLCASGSPACIVLQLLYSPWAEQQTPLHAQAPFLGLHHLRVALLRLSLLKPGHAVSVRLNDCPAAAESLYENCFTSQTKQNGKKMLVLTTGAKLFYLSGMKNGKYMKREVLNLARFISVMKFRPLNWRMAHPYLLTDRLEVQHVAPLL